MAVNHGAMIAVGAGELYVTAAMNDMSMKEKEDMGMRKVGERGSGIFMIGTMADKSVGNQGK
ncbi:MAG: hypothetical protein OJF50_006537 [Nitrospira sp.]|jgi:hypothetical protein|nr:hypothetical protein [Nitrospira sp.]